MELKDRLNELAEAVRKSNEEFSKNGGVKGVVAKSFSNIGFIKNRADRVINQLDQAEWVTSHGLGYFDTGLARIFQRAKAVLEKSNFLDEFDNIVPVGKLRNWIDKLAASSTSYAAIRSFQKREQVKTKLFDFSKKLEENKENKTFKKSQKSFNETNQKLFDDLIELRDGRRIQEGALKMQGPIALRDDQRKRVEKAIKDRTLVETLIAAQISANLEVREGETDLNNKKIAMLGEANDKIEAAKRQYLDKQGYMTYLFNRTFKFTDDRYSAEVDKNGIVVVFDKDGNAIAPNDPRLDPKNPDAIVKVDKSAKGDMFAESIADFEVFSIENIGLTPKSMASRYSRAMKAKVKEAIIEGTKEGYLTGSDARDRKTYVDNLLETLNKQADKDYYKKTREYIEYQKNVTRTKMALDAERYNLYERVSKDYQELLGEEQFKEFTERIANLPEKSARAKAYSELRREIVEGLPGSVLAIGSETLEQMVESFNEIQNKQREIGEKYIEPFLGAQYLSQTMIPGKAPDGTYLVYDPDSKEGKANGGVRSVATFEEAKKYYSFLESPEDLGEFLENPEFRDNSSIQDMTEEEFLHAIENHQLIPTKIAEYKETYDQFLTQTASLDYARDKAIGEVQKGVAAGEVQLNETTRAFLALNDDGSQTWFVEENGETRELLDNSELLSLENLDEDSINGFIETKLMPIKLQELDGLTFNKEHELVDENGTPVFEEADKEAIEERKANLDKRYQKEYIENLLNSAENQNSSSKGKETKQKAGTKKTKDGGTKGSSKGEKTEEEENENSEDPTNDSNNTSGSNSSGASGLSAGGDGNQNQYTTRPYKVGDVNIQGIIKYLQIKKFMSYDLIMESAQRLAIQYSRLATTVSSKDTPTSSEPTAKGGSPSGEKSPEDEPIQDNPSEDENPTNGEKSPEDKEQVDEGNEPELDESDKNKESKDPENLDDKSGEDKGQADEGNELDEIGKELDEAEKARNEAEQAKVDAEKAEADFEDKYEKFIKKEDAYNKAKANTEKAKEKYEAKIKNIMFVEPASKETIDEMRTDGGLIFRGHGKGVIKQGDTTIEYDGDAEVIIPSTKEEVANKRSEEKDNFEGLSAEEKAEIEKLKQAYEDAQKKEANAKKRFENAEARAEKALDDGAKLENIAKEKAKVAQESERSDSSTFVRTIDIPIGESAPENFIDFTTLDEKKREESAINPAYNEVEAPTEEAPGMSEEEKLQARLAAELKGIEPQVTVEVPQSSSYMDRVQNAKSAANPNLENYQSSSSDAQNPPANPQANQEGMDIDFGL